METSSLTALVKKLYEAPLALFTTKTLRDLAGSRVSDAAFYSILSRLTSQHILQKLERDKYMMVGARVHDFRLANFLYEPSYVSLEAALNFRGVLSQFPYEIASVTPRKPVVKDANGRTFRFVRMKQELYWGYEARQGFLLAEPEKALLDLLYLQSKGLARVPMDELDWSRIDKPRLLEWRARFPAMKGVEIP